MILTAADSFIIQLKEIMKLALVSLRRVVDNDGLVFMYESVNQETERERFVWPLRRRTLGVRLQTSQLLAAGWLTQIEFAPWSVTTIIT